VQLRANHHARRQATERRRRDVEHGHDRKRRDGGLDEIVGGAVVGPRAQIEAFYDLHRRRAQAELGFLGPDQAAIHHAAIEIAERDLGVLEGASRCL
jgi:hypothetical protein